MKLFLTATGPGEVASWASIITKKAKKLGIEVIIFLLPSTFSTGKEKIVARRLLPNIKVFSVKETISFLFFSSTSFSGKKVLLHLGGEQVFAYLLSRKLNSPLVIYQWGNKLLKNITNNYLVSHEYFKNRLLSLKIPSSSIKVVGNFCVDKVKEALKEEKELNLQKPLLTFLPASRDIEISTVLPLLLKTAEILTNKTRINFSIVLSPFISIDKLENLLCKPVCGFKGGVRGKLKQNSNLYYLETPKGIPVAVVIDSPYTTIANSKLVVTLPGTKTEEIAALGTPMWVVLPMNRPDLIPLWGIGGLLDYLPCGRILKKYVILKKLPSFGFVTQANIITGREIVPEFKGNINPDLLAEKILKLWQDEAKLNQISSQLIELYKPSIGVCDRTLEILKEVAKTSS